MRRFSVRETPRFISELFDGQLRTHYSTTCRYSAPSPKCFRSVASNSSGVKTYS